MRLTYRRRPRPVRAPAPLPTTSDVERILEWAAAEVRAERRFPWYVSRCPGRFISARLPTAN